MIIYKGGLTELIVINRVLGAPINGQKINGFHRGDISSRNKWSYEHGSGSGWRCEEQAFAAVSLAAEWDRFRRPSGHWPHGKGSETGRLGGWLSSLLQEMRCTHHLRDSDIPWRHSTLHTGLETCPGDPSGTSAGTIGLKIPEQRRPVSHLIPRMKEKTLYKLYSISLSLPVPNGQVNSNSKFRCLVFKVLSR